VLEGRSVILGDGRVAGVVASKAIHHVERKDRDRANKINKLYIDIGAKDRAEAEARVSVGTVGVFDSDFYLFGENGRFMKGKALDDRMGCAALIGVMEAITNDLPDNDLDLYFCFTVREEIGLSGAKVVANRILPELAIVVESTAVADVVDVDASRRVADVGRGGVISVMDRSTIYDRAVIDFALSVGRDEEIPVQLKRYVSGGNDAGSIHKSGEGVRTLALSAPTRYLHSPACVADLDDYRSMIDLVREMLSNWKFD
jgi:endoglucanase